MNEQYNRGSARQSVKVRQICGEQTTQKSDTKANLIFKISKQRHTENVKKQQRGLYSSCNEKTCGSRKETKDIRDFIVICKLKISNI